MWFMSPSGGGSSSRLRCGAFRFAGLRLLHQKMPASTPMAAHPAPMPIPIFAPMLIPEDAVAP